MAEGIEGVEGGSTLQCTAMKPDEVDGILAATLEDDRLSRGEKHAIAELLSSDEIPSDELAFFRHRAFALAKEKLPTHQSRQVLDWLEGVVKALSPPPAAESGCAEVHFSPGPGCLEAIKGQLRRATSSIDICVFTITDDRIASAILEAHRRGVATRVVTDDDKAYDRGSDIVRLADEGLEVRVDQYEHHMHHKFAVFDRCTVVTGSYNWTRSAAQHNRENILITNDERLVGPYVRVFEEMWVRLAPPS